MDSQNEQDTLALFRAFREMRELALRDQLVSSHLHLVHSVARRFSGMGESLDDLIQEGAIGLLNAVDMFDPDRGVRFSTYACHLITGQIQHYLRDRGRLIRQPAWVQELNTKVLKTTELLAQELGRDPLPSEVAERLSLPEESIQNALAARELNRVVSLTAPTDGTGDSSPVQVQRESIRAEKAARLHLPIEDRIVLEEAINNLKTLEQKVVRLFFFEDLNQSEIARKLGISVNYSSYLLHRSIAKIRTTLDEQRIQEAAELLESESPVAHLPADIMTHDPATGAYSGPYLRVRVAEEIARGRRFPTNFALMLVGLLVPSGSVADDHPVLLTLSQFLRGSVRTIDLVAHLESERFALLLPHTGREARVLGERLATNFAQRELILASGSVPLTLCVGFSVFPMDGSTVELLFSRAEQALATARHT